MSEFEDALSEGLEAHRDAVRAKKEIFELFNELSAAVGQRTDHKVAVEAARVEKTTMLQPLAAFVQQTREFVANQLPEEDMPDALFAVRRGGEHGRRAQLCRLKIGVHGYPVEITIEGRFLHAGDRESLKAVLVQLLRHPDVAGKIQKVSMLPVASAVGGAKRELPDGSSPVAAAVAVPPPASDINTWRADPASRRGPVRTTN